MIPQKNGIALLLISAACLLASVNCNSRFFSPTEPTATSDSGLIAVDTPEGQIQWSPYLVVQPDGGAVEGYRKALSALKSRGMVRGARVGLNSYRDPVTQMLVSLGIEMTGIVPNQDLFDPNPEAMIDRYISIYPDIRVFQIGNEVTTINQSQGTPKMTIEQYMDVFLKIYRHVVVTYPSLTLMTQSTIGSGSYGGSELKRMTELGLRPETISPQRVIVGINLYSDDAFGEYVSARSQYLDNPSQGGYRIWVMETGDIPQSNHISHVKSFYPRLASALGAERIYWYALWAGDGPPDAGFSLIQHPYDATQMTYSPLYKALAGMQ